MGVFTTGGGGSFANVGFTMGLILPYLDRVFVGLHILLRVRIVSYACGRFIKGAVGGREPEWKGAVGVREAGRQAAADTDMT